MNFKYITNVNDDKIKITKSYVGLDIETGGLNTRKDNILLIQLSDGENTYILDARMLPKEYILKVLKSLEDKTFIAHNAKFDVGFIFAKYGYIIPNLHDTMLAESVLYAGLGKLMKSLKEVVSERYNLELDKSMQASFLTPTREFSNEQLQYAAQDALILPRIYADQIAEIEDGGFSNVMALENSLIPVVMKMEHYGIGFNPERLHPIIERETGKANYHEQQLFEIAGEEFNPRSWQQLKKIFHKIAERDNFPDLKVDSTGKDVIKNINHPIIKHLLDYRSSQKLVSTYGIKLIEKMEDDGRIHCNYKQYGAETGRFSSSKPNMQNIPHTPEFRHPFVAGEGYQFGTFDYSQIELRLAGIVSGEPEILNEYKKPDADLHRLTASKIYQCDPAEVTKDMRAHGKTGNFSSLYGSSAAGISKKQNIPYVLADKILKGFWGGYRTLNAYRMKVGSDGIKDECSRTPLGRIRYFSRPSSRDPYYKYKIGAIRREAFNMVIQGFAADIMKYSMIMLDKDLGDRGRILLQVHDEVGVEIKDEYVEECKTLIPESMEKSAETMVNNILPMKVEGVIMDSWTK